MAERLGLAVIPGIGWCANEIQAIAREAEEAGFDAIFAAEVNVVRKERLWPRSFFGDHLLESDKRALVVENRFRQPDAAIGECRRKAPGRACREERSRTSLPG